MFSHPSTLLFTALFSASLARSALVEHYWNISYAMANPDGLYERRVIGVNGSWPPPPIYVTQNDTLIVHAFNGLTGPLGPSVGTALHSHGNFFNGSGYYDGAVGVTQCPIPVGGTLDYHIPTDIQTGTYWIHGHFDGQYVDGLRAPLIILPLLPRPDNTTWDAEYTVILSDWYHRQHKDLEENVFLNWRNPTGAEPVPDSAVMYIMHNGTYMNTQAEISNGTGVNNDAYIPFEAGKKYKIRVINMSSLSMFHLMMDNHTLNIIEVDGIEVEPYAVSTLPIAVAQRYSFLVEAQNASSTNYAFMAYQDPDMYDAVPDELILNNTMQIRYDETAAPAESVDVDDWGMFDERVLVPLEVRASAPADVEFQLEFMFDTFDDGTNRASFNNITYQMPKVPSIITTLTMGNDSFLPQVYGAQTHALTYKHMQMVQLIIVNWDVGMHPFHLHGHEFQVISKSFDLTSDDREINPLIQEDQPNPSRRDTILVPPGGSVTLRWRADNPGAWLMHCHIDWHMSSGLAATFIEAPEVAQKSLTMPQVMIDHCKAQGIPTSGNVVGTFSTTDFKGQPYGPFPLVMGWTPKAIGAMAGCIITALLGFLTVVWYGWGELDEEELENEIRRKQLLKESKGGKFGFLKKLGRSGTQ